MASVFYWMQVQFAMLGHSLQTLFGVWRDPSSTNPNYLPATLSETLCDFEQGVSYLIELIGSHGHDTSTLEANLESSITSLLSRLEAGEPNPVVLTQVCDAVESIVRLLASPSLTIENGENEGNAGKNPAIVPSSPTPEASVYASPLANGTSSADFSQSAPAPNLFLASPRIVPPIALPPSPSAHSADTGTTG